MYIIWLDDNMNIKFSSSKNMRYERKFLIKTFNVHEIEMIVKRHPAVFIESYPSRLVNNIYFDTRSMSSFIDNIEGLSKRMKVRIRWYGSLFGKIEKPVLEFKMKEGFVGSKENFKINSFILDKNYSLNEQQDLFSLSGLSDEILEYLKSLQFTLLNCYCRKYYESIDKKYRITIDSKMEFYKIISSGNAFTEKIMDFSINVLELKYLYKYDDNASAITNLFPFRMTKSSKYVMGIDMLNM